MEQTAEELWAAAKKRIRQAIPAHHGHLVDSLHLQKVTADGIWVLTTRDHRAHGVLTNFYGENIRHAIDAIAPGVQYRTVCRTEKAQNPDIPDIQVPVQQNFAGFVEGECNRSALNAVRTSIAPLSSPLQFAPAINPLILHGSVGVGKTHLLHAIHNQMCDWNRAAVVRYETVHQFFQIMSQAIRKQQVEAFRRHYRQLEVVLIDDLQFVEDKKRTQEELLYLYNHLVEQGNGLLVLSINRPLADMKLDPALKQRLQGGLTVRLAMPDLKTRHGILRKQAGRLGLDLPADCIDYLAAQLQNARSMHGALLQLRNQVQMSGADSVDIRSVKEALREQGAQYGQREPPPEKVLDVVANHYNVSAKDMLGVSKARQLVRARQVAMYLLRHLTEKSYPEIGRILGKRDHSTVMHACKKISAARTSDSQLDAALQTLKETLAQT